MATHPLPDARQPALDLAQQQPEYIAQQAEAAIAANASPLASPRQSAFQPVDLISPDLAEDLDDDVAPPAYGGNYGEIRTEKGGLGTTAQVTDDGRVNIRVNQLNRRLSQIFVPGLRQQAQSTEQNEYSPPPYSAAPSDAGDDGVGGPSPPALSVVIQVVGSRGDVQPFIALGQELKGYGHRVRLATHPNFKNFVEQNGLEFFSIGADPSQLMAFMVKNPSVMPGMKAVFCGDVKRRRLDVAEYIQGCWRSCYQAGDGIVDTVAGSEDDDDASAMSGPSARPFVADCIIANPQSFAHIHCAEKLGIPLHIISTMPWSPTQAFPHPLANVQSSNADPQITNYISYAIMEALFWQGLGDIINRFRVRCLGLDPVSLVWGPGMLQRLKVPHTYCWSPALIPKPKDWGRHLDVTGFSFLSSASAVSGSYMPAADLQAFLDAGPPPVYIGFGSIVLDDPKAMTELIFSAIEKTGQRTLLSKGWGGLGGNDSEDVPVPDNVFMLGNVPHDWLFQHVSCVVHHGGAGTTAAGIAAGRPTVVVPFFGDQHFWGAMIARAGAGPHPIPHKHLTADKLADAISFCLRPETMTQAEEFSKKIASESGSEMGARSFHAHLNPDRLRCTLSPSRSAAWRVRRTNIRLSAFSACTLANAGLIDFKDLKLYRPQEYETDEGPWDPLTGGFVAACAAFTDMTVGLTEIPTETYKALKPSRNGKLNGKKTQAEADRPPSPSSASSNKSISQTSQASTAVEKDTAWQDRAHVRKGAGRMTRAFLESPMEISVALTKGLHNLPKIWHDDTVRPHEKITGAASGATAAGKGFGLGLYDGITGLVTQPFNGARKEGAAGFAKGVGKGVGGFFTKATAGTAGLLGYSLKGLHKELDKLFYGSVDSYILASRTAQGYEEWQRSSDEEREDVVEGWKLLKRYQISKTDKSDDIVRDLLQARRAMSSMSRPASWRGRGDSVGSMASARPTTADARSYGHDRESIVSSGSLFSGESLNTRDNEDTARLSARETPENSSTTEQEDVRQALAASQIDEQSNAHQDRQYEQQLEQAIAESLKNQKQGDSYGGVGLGEGENNGGHLIHELDGSARSPNKGVDMPSSAAAASSGAPFVSASFDRGHLAGTTRDQFEAQQTANGGEKTAQEMLEEKIVLEYVKKQSLLEQHYQGKGKARELVTENVDNPDS